MKPAFVFLGGFQRLCESPAYLSEIRRRGIMPLYLTCTRMRRAVDMGMSDPDHPASDIHQVMLLGEISEPGVLGCIAVWAQQYRIMGIQALEDAMVEPASVAADLLGLASPGLRAARICRSRYLRGVYCREWTPRSVVLPPGGRRAPIGVALGWPAVLHPGGRRVSGLAELRECLDGYPPEETLLVEEYVEGHDVAVDSLVQNGRVIAETPDPRLYEANQAILARLNFSDGAARAEFRVTDQGRICLLKLSAAPCADSLQVPNVLRIALGEPIVESIALSAALAT